MAKLLVERGEAKPNDFVIFSGYVGWAPNKLKEELERGNWFMVATDSKSISDLLFLNHGSSAVNSSSSREEVTGVHVWKHWMERIDKCHIVADFAAIQSFEDAMLNKWIEDKRSSSPFRGIRPPNGRLGSSNMSDQSRWNGHIIQPLPDDEIDLPQIVQAGTIFRAIRPIILDEQVFHRSLVLILKIDERGRIGVILNRPSSLVTTLNSNNKSGGNYEVAVRYGGRYGLGEEGPPETWLHYGNMALQDARVGSPIVIPFNDLAATNSKKNTTIWQCSRQDAEIAVALGLASASDFLVTWGFTLWETQGQPNELGRRLTTTSLEDDFKPVHKSVLPSLWKELLKQSRLTDETFELNLDYASAAYEIALSDSRSRNDDQTTDEDHKPDTNDFLADYALRRWIRMFIMGSITSSNGPS